jgi:hypothetical protein
VAFFTETEPYEREIVDPDSGEKATVKMRALNAGDRARLTDVARMKVLEASDLAEDEIPDFSMPMGTMTLLTVEAAVVSWSLPQPPTPDTIRALKPNVLEQIFSHVAIGAVEEPEDDAGPLDEQSEPSEHSSDELVEVHS